MSDRHSARRARDLPGNSVPYVNLMQNARAGARGYSHTVATENLDEFGVYG